MVGLIKVTGVSMAPLLNDGDYILTFKPRTPHAGRFYVIAHDRHGQIIKRLSAINGQMASFDSINPEGSSGEITASQIKARAWLAITPKGIKRL